MAERSVMPRYANTGTLRGRGGIDGRPLNRQYVAPSVPPPPAAPVIPPPANVVRGGSFTPEQIIDQAMNSTAAGFMDPAERDNMLAQLYRMATQPVQQTGSSPSVPHGGPLPPRRPHIEIPQEPGGGTFTPEQAIDMALTSAAASYLDPAQLDNLRAGVTRDITSDPAVRARLEAQDPLTPMEVASAAIPVLEPALDVPITPGGTTPRDIANNPIAREAARIANEAQAAPEQWWYDKQMEASIEYARTGKLPTWANIFYTDVPGQQYIPDWAPGNAKAGDKWFLPDWLEAHPEDRALVAQIADEAEANGQDPKAAVDAWWSQKQGFIVNMLSRGINDPLNAVGFVGAVGRGLGKAGDAAEAVEGLRRTGQTMRAAGKVLEVPDMLVNAPWRVAAPVLETSGGLIRRGAEKIPGYRTLADFMSGPSGRARYHRAVSDIESDIQAGELVPQPNLADYPDVPPAGPETPNGPTPPPGPSPHTSPLPTDEGAALAPEPSAVGSNGRVRGPVTEDAAERGTPQLQLQSRPTQLALEPPTVESVVPEMTTGGARTAERTAAEQTAADVPTEPPAPTPRTRGRQRAPEPEPEPAQTPADLADDVQRAAPEPATTETASPLTAPQTQAEPQRALPTMDRAAGYNAPHGPSGLLLEGAQPNERSGWSLSINPERKEQPPLAMFKEQVDRDFPEQAARINAAIEPYATEFYEPNYNAGRKAQWGPSRMGRTTRPLLEADLMTQYRLAARLEGVPTEGLVWRMNSELAGQASFDYEKIAHRFIFEKEIDQRNLDEAFRRGVFSKDGLPTGKLTAEEAQAAKLRYDMATEDRTFVHATDAELDDFIRRSGVSPAPEPVTARQAAALPTADDLAKRGNEYARAIMDEIDATPRQYRAAIQAEVAPWAEARYRDFDLLSPIGQTMTDLELAGRLRVAALRSTGVDLNPLAVAGGRIPGEGGSWLPTDTLDDFAWGYGGRYDDLEALRAGRGRDILDLDGAAAQGIDIEDVLEQHEIVRRGPFDAQVREIRAHNQRARASRVAPKNIPKGVYLDQIGLPGYVSRDADTIEDAYRALVDDGFPTKRIGDRVSARDASITVDPSPDMLARVILGNDDVSRDARAILHRRDDIAFRSTPPGPLARDTADGAFEMRGYRTYQSAYAIRTMIRGDAESALRVADNFDRPLVRADWEIDSTVEYVRKTKDGVRTSPGYQPHNPLTGQRGDVFAKRESAQKWIDQFPEADDGTWLTVPECFI
jgi:hypothetical protein